MFAWNHRCGLNGENEILLANIVGGAKDKCSRRVSRPHSRDDVWREIKPIASSTALNAAVKSWLLPSIEGILAQTNGVSARISLVIVKPQ